MLLSDGLPAVASTWSRGLGISEQSLLRAVYAGSDEGVLVGRQSEEAWWPVVASRLGIGPGPLGGLREAIVSAGVWDDQLLDYLRSVRNRLRVVVVSNAWPHLRARLTERHIEEIAEPVVLSCEVGYAKPDPRIFQLALGRLRIAADDALLVDDTPVHVASAVTAGLRGHLHTTRSATIAAIDAFLGDPPRTDP